MLVLHPVSLAQIRQDEPDQLCAVARDKQSSGHPRTPFVLAKLRQRLFDDLRYRRKNLVPARGSEMIEHPPEEIGERLRSRGVSYLCGWSGNFLIAASRQQQLGLGLLGLFSHSGMNRLVATQADDIVAHPLRDNLSEPER